MTLTDSVEQLRSVGLRVTRPRQAVLGVVRDHPHATAPEVFTAVREALPSVSQQAVYDCLGALSEAGLLRRIDIGGGVSRYESRVGDNHHHLVCTSCGTIVDIDCATGEAPCLSPDHDHGFDIAHADVVYRGLCPACRAARE